MEKIKKPSTVDEYIFIQPEEVKEKLNQIRDTIRHEAPMAIEKISYGMPSYSNNGILIYFAAHSKHISIYPFPSAMEAFSSEIKAYRTSKGTIQFQLNKPLPLKLIAEIVKFRIMENKEKEEIKKMKKKA